MYFQMSFPVPSLKHLAARFLHHCYDIETRPTILISLECAGCQQCNGTSPVCIRCMVLEIQLFFLLLWGPSSRKHGATTFWNPWIKNNCISKTMQCIQMGLVPLRCWQPAHSNDINIIGLICSFGCPQRKTKKFTIRSLRERPTQHSATPFSTRGSYDDKYQACSSRVL